MAREVWLVYRVHHEAQNWPRIWTPGPVIAVYESRKAASDAVDELEDRNYMRPSHSFTGFNMMPMEVNVSASRRTRTNRAPKRRK